MIPFSMEMTFFGSCTYYSIRTNQSLFSSASDIDYNYETEI